MYRHIDIRKKFPKLREFWPYFWIALQYSTQTHASWSCSSTRATKDLHSMVLLYETETGHTRSCLLYFMFWYVVQIPIPQTHTSNHADALKETYKTRWTCYPKALWPVVEQNEQQNCHCGSVHSRILEAPFCMNRPAYRRYMVGVLPIEPYAKCKSWVWHFVTGQNNCSKYLYNKTN